MHRYFLVLFLVVTSAGMAGAATWADRMFDNLSRDFGTVPTGPVISHPFRIVNKTRHEMRIRDVRVSCGCVTARVVKNSLAPGEESAIVAEIDTRRFSGTKTVTIYVRFDRPSWDEVRLWVRANSRSDVGILPETLAFGRIKRGETPSQNTQISLFGSSRYRILSVKADSNYILPVCKMVRSDTHEVTYQLTARLRHDTPPGRWYTDVWLTTNNPTAPKLRIPLTVEIESALSVNPNVLLLGQVRVGAEEVRKIIVRGVRPFRITGVAGAGSQLRVYNSSKEKRSVHVLTISLRPDRTGQIDRTLYIQTDLKSDNSIDFVARAFAVR